MHAHIMLCTIIKSVRSEGLGYSQPNFKFYPNAGNPESVVRFAQRYQLIHHQITQHDINVVQI